MSIYLWGRSLVRRVEPENRPSCQHLPPCRWFPQLVNQSELMPSEKSFHLPNGCRSELFHRFSNFAIKPLQLSELLSGFLCGSHDFWTNRRRRAVLFLVVWFHLFVPLFVKLVMTPFTLWATIFSTFDKSFDFVPDLLGNFLPDYFSFGCLSFWIDPAIVIKAMAPSVGVLSRLIILPAESAIMFPALLALFAK